MKIGDTSWPQGDITRIECPDPNRYGGFVEVAAVQGARERATTQLMGRYPRDLSKLLEYTRRRCRLDIHVHVGKCKNPQDFLGGWDKIKIYRDAQITDWSDENAGALESGDQNPTNETAEISAEEVYEVVPLAFAEQATAEVVREILDIIICDQISCGDCDDPSKGCEKVFALMIGADATPGTAPSVVYTGDGGTSWSTTAIDTLTSTELPSMGACVAGNLVIVSNDGGFHYANLDEIIAGTETWVEVDPYGAGVVWPAFPEAISSADARNTWAVGSGGYIWFAADPTITWTTQDAGVATAQDLADVHAFNADIVVAVGGSNAVVLTDNGGSTWQSVTGPAVGVALTAVWVLAPTIWLVGDANGDLWYTLDSGANWTEIALPGTPSGIQDIKFVDDTVGYLAIDQAGPAGNILRTLDGGATWYVLPEKAASGSIPENDAVNALAVCTDDHNVVFGGGLGGDGSDGFIVKAS
jgi:photosystem II stability/assembly factor-like uncharacterized protein